MNDDTPANPAPREHYVSVLAEVIYATDIGIAAQRVQFFSKNDNPTFPARRLYQLQNVAAMKIKQELADASGFKPVEVFLLSLVPLGQMTEAEFWEGMDTPNLAPPVAPAETAVTDSAVLDVRSATVTPIR